MSRDSTRKIGIIGRVDLGRTMFDGQTVKTRMMYRLLCEMFGENAITVVDTLDYRHRAVGITLKVLHCLLACDDVFVLLSENGRRVLFPLLAFVARHRGVRVYHNLIGGWLARNLDRYPKWASYLNSFEVNWVESSSLAETLYKKGVRNARYLPNFKYLVPCPDSAKESVGPDYRFCTFSRVTEKKGISDAMQAVEKVSQTYTKGAISLDVYGPVDEAYREEFETLLKHCPHSQYCGCVTPEESVSAISPYDALLFPTKWELEGIPGTVIDALAAGVPIIACKWGYYNEMLEDGVTGLSYKFGEQDRLVDCIRDFIALGDRTIAMRSGCRERAKAYSPEMVRSEIENTIRA